MINFKPIEISDYGVFRDYLAINSYLNSEYNFTTMYAWQIVYQTEYTVLENCLCVRFLNKNGKHAYYLPLGDAQNTLKALDALAKFAESEAYRFIIISASEKMIETMRALDREKYFVFEPKRESFDYIYKREKLVKLGGKKLHGKRNHYNFFTANYNYSLEEITEDNIEECRVKLKELIMERSLNPGEELNATMMALEYRNELHLTGRCLYAEGNLAGVILAENHHGMALIQIAKSDIKYRGASVALFKLFLEEFFTECEYVNFMEDMGLDGLRQAKLSYDPEYLLEKSTGSYCGVYN